MFISELESLDFLPEMKNIEDIFFWNVKDDNLNYILESRSLKEFNFTPEKKYYTHKHDDLLKLFEKQGKNLLLAISDGGEHHYE